MYFSLFALAALRSTVFIKIILLLFMFFRTKTFIVLMPLIHAY